MVITFKDITKSYNGSLLFKNISFQINHNDKIGLIGKNGVGKTTLIKILMSEEKYDKGLISISPEYLKIGYLKQFNKFDEEATVNEKLQAVALSSSTAANSSSYGRKLRDSLMKLGFKEKDINKKISKLSGGEKTKLSLCLVLSESPDMLILDEPTNHLDVEAIKWLEEFLNSINITLLIVSHDRLFLDNTVNKILEMKSDGIKSYHGNYSAYVTQREHEYNYMVSQNKKQTGKIKELEYIINARSKWFHKSESEKKATRLKNAGNRHCKDTSNKHIKILRSKEKELEKIKANMIEVPKEDRVPIFKNLCNTVDEKLPNYLIKVSRLKKSFSNRLLFTNGAFNVKKGDKIALLGKNGSGKTTLLKILLGQERADVGSIDITSSLNIGYFSQELESLNPNNSILDELLKSAEDKIRIRKILGSLLFREEDVFKKIENLSMGEKCRVAFAKLMLSDINMLILDEPTNHMDIPSKESIENVLENYNGTIIFVSHDRYFVNKLAARIFEIENQSIKAYEGNYQYYLFKKAEEKNKQKLGNSCKNIKDEITILECELAYLSSKLRRHKNCFTVDTDDETVQRFLETSEKLNEYKRLICS